MGDIEAPKVERTDYDNLEFSTEVAFNALRDRAIQDGLVDAMLKGTDLMYLPDQAVTRQFIAASRAVIDCLRNTTGLAPVKNSSDS